MKKKLLATVSAAAFVLSAAFSLAACGSAKWFKNAKTAFKNGRFAPEVRDVLPGAMLACILPHHIGFLT